jgi:hypothetical protein
MSRRAFPIAALACIASALAACDDPFKPTAREETHTDTLVAFALTGTPADLPSALSILGREVVRPDGTLGFDVAFDLDPQGKVLLHPVRVVGGPSATGRTVGMQKITGSFDNVTRAPDGGYKYDSTFVLSVGDGVVLQVLNSTFCQLEISQLIYAKLQIDVVDTSQRAIRFHMVHDPNCGFRSFLAGIPKG